MTTDTGANPELSEMCPRPRKHRHCHCRFKGGGDLVFKPAAVPLKQLKQVQVDHDEIEAVYMCDGLGLTQEEAGQKMGVSRGTVQRLVTNGRKKIILAIMEENALFVGAARLSHVLLEDSENHGIRG